MKTPLPIDSYLPKIVEEWRKHNALVLSAAPGTGKTTRVPPAILEHTDKEVWVLEPRRIAAIASSQRIAKENGWQLGKQVGYQVRFDNKSSKETRLLFLTEALLLRKLLQSPRLEQVGCVILDEFHERSLSVDLALAALKELQELERPDLKILVMSATLDAEKLVKYLDAPAISVPGKLFPLEIVYSDKAQSLRTGLDFRERMGKLVQKAYRETQGDLLCFLPGRGEIQSLQTYLEDSPLAQSKILPLHGQLHLEEQNKALEPCPGFRKIILATNVAESSLTVEGVRTVVDSGLMRQAQIHPKTGFPSLELARISKASATQRAGRAARLGPGKVYRAWTPYDELSFKEHDVPEIQRSDLSESLLLLAALGISSFENFSWFEAPNPRLLQQAIDFLQTIGALDENKQITTVGRELRQYPVHPRIARILLAGKKNPYFSSELAALLSEPKQQAFSSAEENDLWARYGNFKKNPRNLQKVAEQLRQNFSPLPEKDADRPSESLCTELVFTAYSDRLCRRRRPEDTQAKMLGGRGVRLHPDSSVKKSEYFLALELSEGRDQAETLVFEAIGLSENFLLEKLSLTPSQSLDWDEEKKRFFVIESKAWHGLSIGAEHRRPAKPEEIEGKLAPIAWKQWPQLKQKNKALGIWWQRLEYASRFYEEAKLSDETLHAALDEACYGENNLSALEEKDLVYFIQQKIPAHIREILEKEFPEHWVVPSGSKLPVQYSEEQGPLVEVRLQELFGLKQTPKIAGQNLTLVLLAPNYRPVQVTKDIESFWKSAYAEVRKELKTRYPKHSWPEDPTTAPPQAKGRPRI